MTDHGNDVGWQIPNDPFGAFCRDNHTTAAATGSGAIDGLTFAAKDVMDIAGSTTGFGQPTWLATHQPATAHAEPVARLLAAGASLVGRTVSDELSYSLSGENIHYGTPVNPAAPDRIAGGSSSGSVCAVAAGLVDIAIGTDCAGSVRLPASYCGVPGMRPTHAGVSTQGVNPFAPSFDTVGWFAKNPSVLRLAGIELLDGDPLPVTPGRLLIATDAFTLVDPLISRALKPAIARVEKHFSATEGVIVSDTGLDSWMECFRTIQAAEIWQSLGPWIESEKPQFGPGIDERIDWARQVTERQVADARQRRKVIVDHLRRLLRPGDVLCLPTSPRVAPKTVTPVSAVEVTFRYQAICLLSIAGLGGMPEISMPLATVDGLPLGLSLVASEGADHQLLDLACELA